MFRRLMSYVNPPPARAWWWMVPYTTGYFACLLGDFTKAHHVATWIVVSGSIAAGMPLALADKLYERAVRRAVCRDRLSPKESVDMDERAIDLAGAKGIDA
jgi:hypothetical protein